MYSQWRQMNVGHACTLHRQTYSKACKGGSEMSRLHQTYSTDSRYLLRGITFYSHLKTSLSGTWVSLSASGSPRLSSAARCSHTTTGSCVSAPFQHASHNRTSKRIIIAIFTVKRHSACTMGIKSFKGFFKAARSLVRF